jgi:hypothetical protein
VAMNHQGGHIESRSRCMSRAYRDQNGPYVRVCAAGPVLGVVRMESFTAGRDRALADGNGVSIRCEALDSSRKAAQIATNRARKRAGESVRASDCVHSAQLKPSQAPSRPSQPTTRARACARARGEARVQWSAKRWRT